MGNRLIGCFSFALLIACSEATTLAGLPSCESFTIATKDEEHLFVMLSPYRSEDAAAGVSLRDKFAQSGLYRKADLQLQWAVPWYSFENELVLSFDGRHVMRCNRAGYSNSYHKRPESWGIKIYSRGVELSSFEAKALGPGPDLLVPYSSDVAFDWARDYGLKRSEGAEYFFLRTWANDTYLFDPATGSIARSNRNRDWIWFSVAVVLLTLLLLSIPFFKRVHSQTSRPR